MLMSLPIPTALQHVATAEQECPLPFVRRATTVPLGVGVPCLLTAGSLRGYEIALALLADRQTNQQERGFQLRQ